MSIWLLYLMELDNRPMNIKAMSLYPPQRVSTKLAFFLLVLLLWSPLLHGQVSGRFSAPESTVSPASHLVQDGTHFVRVGIALVAAPLHFNGRQWCNVGLILGGTVALFTVDPYLRDWAIHNQNEFNAHVFNFDAWWGDKYTLAFSGILYGGGLLFQQKPIRLMGLHSLEAILYAGTLTHVFKTILGRRRPYGGENHLVFKPFKGVTLYRSLPSGHTTGAFAVSTVLAKSLDNVWWKTFWYGTAVMVGASRIYHNAHWLSDVFLGSVIGYSVGSFIVHFEKDAENNSQNASRYGISLSFTSNRVGWMIRF